jgi:redox-sensitive bicupin YhaK (pirin superfamily)
MKQVLRVERDAAAHWVGDGFPVRTLFSYHSHGDAIDPFLLLDYAGPHRFDAAEQPRGVGAHPHRGFETVTIVLQGEVEHRDSAGNHGVVGPGDVQWMTAAAGVIHEEFHSRAFTKRGGTFEVLQLWVNLPAANKSERPAYQDLRAADIPQIPLPDGAGTARIIAGELLGTRGPARTHTPLLIADLELSGNRAAPLSIPDGHTALLVVRTGELRVNGGDGIPGLALVQLSRDGRSVELQAADASRALLIAGAPLGEPIAGSGPFVMNTDAEIRDAYRDFRAGRMGALPA